MEYTIRRSPRARHVWLRFNNVAELVVVVPRRFDVKLVPGIVESKQEWIRQAVARAVQRREDAERATSSELPAIVELPAIGERWSVEYRETCSRRVSVGTRSGGRVVVSGAVSDVEASRRALLRWLRRVARSRLTSLLMDLAAEEGFALERVSVRCQRTRWASCSRNGAISLNIRLLFVAPALARHVMLHELCHTRRMDHSEKFWKLLEQYDVEWRNNRRMLRAEWRRLPGWVSGPLARHG